MQAQPLPTTWDLTPLAHSDDDPAIEHEQKVVDEAVKQFVAKWKQRDDWLHDSRVLKEALDAYEELMRLYGTTGRAGYYATLRSTQEQFNPKVKALLNRTDESSIKRRNALQFFTHRLARVDAATQKQFLAAPQLKQYRHFLERVFEEARYLLSEPEESILRMISLSAYARWVDLVSALLSKEEREVKGEKEKKTFEELQSMTEHADAGVRKEAADALTAIMQQHIDVAEAEMNAILLYKKMTDELRGFERADTERHVEDDIDTAVVDTLITTVSKRFGIAQRFYALKAQLLGMKQLHYYERNAAVGKMDKTYAYEGAVTPVESVLRQLDSEFGDIFNRFVTQGAIDVYPKKGKRGGAYCTGNLLTQPTYILLNFTGRLKDVETLAHEVGHGINNELMKSKVHALAFETPKSTAEVASTFMEDFVFEELLQKADDAQRLAILMHKINGDISTIFRQAAFYRFEQELHDTFRKQGALSREEMGKLFVQHVTEYLGKAVDCSDAGLWWSYIPHFRDFFYVFSYTSGLLISKALQAQVRKDKNEILKVKEFLSAGTNASPQKLFLNMGIDITKKEFWNSGLDEMEQQLHEAETLAKKLGKIA